MDEIVVGVDRHCRKDVEILRQHSSPEWTVQRDANKLVIEDVVEDSRITVTRQNLDRIVGKIAIFFVDTNANSFYDGRVHVLQTQAPHLTRVTAKEKFR